MGVTKQDIQKARYINLYDYLTEFHKDLFNYEGDSIRFKENHSISIKRGYSGYYDFSSGEKGNSIDFLTKYLSYNFTDAVKSLCESSLHNENSDATRSPNFASNSDENKIIDNFIIPPPLNGKYKHLYAYLTSQRNFPKILVQKLIDQELIFETKVERNDKEAYNIVFISPKHDFLEIRGTNSFRPFKMALQKEADRYWYFKVGENPKKVYICESSIDAISLYIFNKYNKKDIVGIYVGLTGVAKYGAVDSIQEDYPHCKIYSAVDNDKAGDKFREKYPEFEHLIPTKKDWNEDIQDYIYDSWNDDDEIINMYKMIYPLSLAK